MENYEDILHMERPVSERHRMEIGHRAKQFAPFAALKGFEESVKKKELVYIDRPILAEDQKEMIDRVLQQIGCGMGIYVDYFEECLHIPGKGLKKVQQGTIEALESSGYLEVNSVRIEIENILRISVEKHSDVKS